MVGVVEGADPFGPRMPMQTYDGIISLIQSARSQWKGDGVKSHFVPCKHNEPTAKCFGSEIWRRNCLSSCGMLQHTAVSWLLVP